MTPKIRELDERTRERIAAGEVVERPASVVKELVENALDAGASRVDVSVEAGGADRIVVSDDGVGMSEAAVRKAVREHTTSKLRAVDDLEAIGTLGFRGEALHAIGSVARMAIRTRPRGGSRGTELIVEGGDVVDCGPTGCPEGTTVEVTELFGNVPARRKYLKTDTTEFAHVQEIVAGYALAEPSVAVSLARSDREAFATTGDGDRQSAVLAVYGREVAASMIAVESREIDGSGPLEEVTGLVSHPETNRAGREYVTTLVNGRYVTAGAIREAIVEAYGTQLAPDRYPFAVIDVDVPPGGVDVNVHPRKLEVLFAEEEEIRKQVRSTIESALLDAGLLRSRAPRGRSAPEQTEIEETRKSDGPANPSDGGEAEAIDVDAAVTDSDGSEPSTEPAVDSTNKGEFRVSPETKVGAGAGGVSSGTDAPEDDPSPGRSPPVGDEDGANDGSTADRDESGSGDGSDNGDDKTTNSTSAGSGVGSDRKFRAPASQRTLNGDGDGDAATPESFRRLPSMKVLGQFDETYVVAETDDGLLLIDQHAADERINYERLRERFEGDVTTQTLADPVAFELTAREATLAEAGTDALARLGFRARVGGGELVVTTVPALLAEQVGETAPELARDLLGELVDGDPGGTVEAVADELLGNLACYPSIKGKTSLTEGRVTDLLSALDDCENPYACPHGRPTVIELSHEEIGERFERDYPGHAGRREM